MPSSENSTIGAYVAGALGGRLAGLVCGVGGRLAGLVCGVGGRLAGVVCGVGGKLAGVVCGVGGRLAGLVCGVGAHSTHRFPAPSSLKEGCREPVLGVWCRR